MRLNNLNLFGKFNPIIDEGVHIFLSLIIFLIGLSVGFKVKTILIIFFAGILLDADHIINPHLAKKIKIKSYTKTHSYGSDGYTIKILHGFDVSLIFGILALILSSNPVFAVLFFANLCLHELWDFLVYTHNWKELFLITRIMANFKPGERKHFKGIFFKISSLNY